MNWKFWKKKKPKVSNKTEFIEGWRLKITTNYGKKTKTFEHPELKNLWKIYGWYLTRDSEKYNVESKQGYDILHRYDILNMELRKIKLPKEDWIKENDDETETD